MDVGNTSFEGTEAIGGTPGFDKSEVVIESSSGDVVLKNIQIDPVNTRLFDCPFNGVFHQSAAKTLASRRFVQ